MKKICLLLLVFVFAAIGVMAQDSSDIIWQIQTKDMNDHIIRVDISPDSKYVVTDCITDNYMGIRDSLITRIWDINNGTLLQEFIGETSFCFSKDGTILLTKHKDSIILRENGTWLIIKAFDTDGLGSDFGYGFDISPDNKFIVCSARLLGLKIFEIETGNLKKKLLNFPFKLDNRGHGSRSVDWSQYNSDGTQIYFSGDWTFVYDVAKDTIINKFEGVRPILSPDNKHMVNIYYNRENYTDFFKIIIYDLFSNTLISSVSLGQYIYKFRYSNDGKNIVAVNISKKGSVEIWDAFSGIKKYSYNIPLLAYDGVASSNDGKYVSTFSGQNLFLLGQRFTSIHEEKNSIFTNIYPNPSTGFVKIDFDLQNSELVVLRITDNAGAVINTINLGLLEPGNNSYRYDVSGLAGGVYYITLQGGIELGSYRFVKE